MSNQSLLNNNLKKLTTFSLLGLAIGVGALLAGGAQAMMTTNSSGTTTNNFVQPYNGGAPVSKVFYPNDGSTMTITCTGAVIKQSPGGNPYRQGWVNPDNARNINTVSDLRGQLASGSTNPFGSNNNCPTSNQSSSQQPSSNNNQPSSNMPSTTSQTPSASATATANATANANATLTGSSPTTSSTSTRYTSQTPVAPVAQNYTPPAPASTPAYTSSSSRTYTPAAAQNQNNYPGKSLPNTGPGNVLVFSGIATVLGTIGHFMYQRFRFRSLA